ncbi:phosphate ABC transporter, ATPase subunit [Candidatus Moduliflexus flocculans]|uniref:Phosphate ABC transporter, ATPase subunit n=1 Tax=Candidatus Moduliflexus flocculans TaxID=1499966 RepID=A0A0S6VVS8_9BACT|nr:phosphate ABC transporter, ATPase subunit [Candidatus Moduliflexus flocculans]
MNAMLSQESRKETLPQPASSGDHAITMKHQEQKPQETRSQAAVMNEFHMSANDLPSIVPPKISARALSFFYGQQQALFENNLDIAAGKVTAIIGPSGCGKSTHLRVYNRVFELYRDQKASGEVLFDGQNLLSPSVDLIELRRRIGMIFQKPTPFPLSVFENVAYGLRLHFKMPKSELKGRVESALKLAALLDEVKDKLDKPGIALSGGQQQRLCIARTIALEPEVLLMDEPTSAIDPVATSKIEDLMESLKGNYTIVIVTHSMQQAARISDFTAFFYKGYIVEYGPTKQIFTNPANKQTEDYITGRFG